MKRTSYLSIFLLFFASLSQAQVGIGTILPNASSLLEVQSTTKGVLIPRMTSGQRTAIATPAEGLMVFQTNAPAGLWMIINGVWTRLANANSTDLYGASTGYAANTSGTTLNLALLGTAPVPFPNAQNLGSNISVNPAGTVFTVATAGRYRISYVVNLTAGLLSRTELVVNGATVAAGSYAAALAVNRFASEVVLTLPANSTVQLNLISALSLSLLNGGPGAYITIQRVE
ncbi:BclA C-terminal domain-containing protein [Paraflavitalea pollutisoli]|uniref:BclA C-terminal domain-containing protein n=1 Tax=Paraflavitalea pollutisoli TaxID=3034143 RepID=UPI0023EBA081|nr:hypothetical protein [Paraflavitalea sp. H1-2-19X]